VNKRFLLASVFCFSLIFIFFSCKKINESTTLGDDVIPGVDGITTFEAILPVDVYNGLFDGITDSSSMSENNDHMLGNILTDPLFGKTNAKLFLELKPNFNIGRFTFSGITNPDSLHLDSIVMILGWRGTYGDTLAPQRIKVYEMDLANDFRYDTAYQIRQQYFTYSNLLGTKDIFPNSLRDSVKAFKDTTANQLRIRLNDNFGNLLLKGPNFDSAHAYSSDSAFRTYFKGFAVEADNSFGNAIMTFGLSNEPNTKLAIYYHFDKNGISDTTVSYFQFTNRSAHHNFINRNFTGSEMLAAQGGPAQYAYLLNVPGSFATVKIPGLRNFDNSIVHRAELIMEQVYDVSDKNFIPPQAIFLDLYDSSISKYKVVPYDFVLDNAGVIFQQFGMYGKSSADVSGNPIRTWNFNLTRYVQNILTKKEPVHNLRLLSHWYVTDQYKADNGNNAGNYSSVSIPVNSLFTVGRVRVGGGNHPTQKMRLRIVYSKI
jgi:hypothetical protein